MTYSPQEVKFSFLLCTNIIPTLQHKINILASTTLSFGFIARLLAYATFRLNLRSPHRHLKVESKPPMEGNTTTSVFSPDMNVKGTMSFSINKTSTYGMDVFSALDTDGTLIYQTESSLFTNTINVTNGKGKTLFFIRKKLYGNGVYRVGVYNGSMFSSDESTIRFTIEQCPDDPTQIYVYNGQRKGLPYIYTVESKLNGTWCMQKEAWAVARGSRTSQPGVSWGTHSRDYVEVFDGMNPALAFATCVITEFLARWQRPGIAGA